MICPETMSVGTYVLGALDAAERLELERHIAWCGFCREELLRLASLPGLLHRVSAEDVIDPLTAVAPPDLPPPPPALPPSPRRIARPRMLLAAAIVVLVVLAGGLVGRQLLADPASQVANSVTWSATDGAYGIDTIAHLSTQPWGTDIQLKMEHLSPGQTCMLVVHSRTGQSETAGWWSTGGGTLASVPGSTSIKLPDIDRVDVVRSDNVVLATLTPASR